MCGVFASLLHFAHDAEYLAVYPGMPAWLMREHVWSAHTWMMNFAIGFEAVTGVLLAVTAIAWMRGHNPSRSANEGG